MRPSTSGSTQMNGVHRVAPPQEAPLDPPPEPHNRPDAAPAMLSQHDPSGYFAGPTSALSHLIAVGCTCFKVEVRSRAPRLPATKATVRSMPSPRP